MNFKTIKAELEKEMMEVRRLPDKSMMEMRIRGRRRHIVEVKLSMLNNCEKMVLETFDKLDKYNALNADDSIIVTELKAELGLEEKA